MISFALATPQLDLGAHYFSMIEVASQLARLLSKFHEHLLDFFRIADLEKANFPFVTVAVGVLPPLRIDDDVA